MGAPGKRFHFYRTVQVWQCFVYLVFSQEGLGKGQQRKQVFRIDVNGLCPIRLSLHPIVHLRPIDSEIVIYLGVIGG